MGWTFSALEKNLSAVSKGWETVPNGLQNRVPRFNSGRGLHYTNQYLAQISVLRGSPNPFRPQSRKVMGISRKSQAPLQASHAISRYVFPVSNHRKPS